MTLSLSLVSFLDFKLVFFCQMYLTKVKLRLTSIVNPNIIWLLRSGKLFLSTLCFWWNLWKDHLFTNINIGLSLNPWTKHTDKLAFAIISRPGMTHRRPWRRHQMEKMSALMGLCEGNPPVTSVFPSQRSATWNFDGFFYLRLRLSDQSKRRWFGTPWCSLWRCYNVIFMLIDVYFT